MAERRLEEMTLTAASTQKPGGPAPPAPPRTRRSPNTESDCARPPHRSDPRRPRVRFHIGIGDLAAPLVFRRGRHKAARTVLRAVASRRAILFIETHRRDAADGFQASPR